MSYLPPEDSDFRLFIVHPDDRVMRRHISELVGKKPFLYTCFSGTNVAFDEAQNTVFCNFDCIGDCETYPDAFVIDECDRLMPEAFNHLVPYLIQCNPIPVVLFSRNFPSLLIEDDKLFHQTKIITTSEPIFDAEYNQLPVLEVFGFGRGRARINGHDIALSPGDLLHEIFFYLLENPIVQRDDLITRFWSHLDPKAAIINFHVTRQKLNELIGIEFLVLRGGYYEVNPNMAIYYDVRAFREAVSNELLDTSAHKVERFQQAYRLHHHDFVLGSKSEWIVRLRQELRDLQCDVCVELAKASSLPNAAIGFYSHAFRYNPYREDIAYAMMSNYMQLGLFYDALKVYEALEDNLWQRQQIMPNKFIQRLWQQAKVNCRA